MPFPDFERAKTFDKVLLQWLRRSLQQDSALSGQADIDAPFVILAARPLYQLMAFQSV